MEKVSNFIIATIINVITIILVIIITPFSLKVGLTKGSEYPAHPDIPTISLIATGLFTFIITAGNDDAHDVIDDNEDADYDDHHHNQSS